MLFKRAWSALISGPLKLPSRKKGKRKYTKKKQLYLVKSQVSHPTPHQSHFPGVEGWNVGAGMVCSVGMGLQEFPIG